MISRKLLVPLADPLVDTPVSLVSYSFAGPSAAMPTHQTGDLLVGVAMRFDAPTAPGRPSGWTQLLSVGGNISGFDYGRIIASKVAASSSEAAEFLNAQSVIRLVFRGSSAVGDIDSTGTTNLSVMPLGSGALDVQDGSSFIVQCIMVNAAGRTFVQPDEYYNLAGSADVSSIGNTLLFRAGRIAQLEAKSGSFSPTGTNIAYCQKLEILA